MSPPTRGPRSAPAASTGWVTLRVRVPASWKKELREASVLRATSMSDLVRAAIREVMLERPR